MARLMGRPAPVEVSHKNLRFLITHMPNDRSIAKFVEVLHRHDTDTLVRVCRSTYKTQPLTEKGIKVLDWEYEDGSPPPKMIVDNWLQMLKVHVRENPTNSIAVHCVAGLGRAPVLVAVALMESGMKFNDAVDFIRKKRRGAINNIQLEYLEKYRPKYCLKSNRTEVVGCCVM